MTLAGKQASNIPLNMKPYRITALGAINIKATIAVRMLKLPNTIVVFEKYVCSVIQRVLLMTPLILALL